MNTGTLSPSIPKSQNSPVSSAGSPEAREKRRSQLRLLLRKHSTLSLENEGAAPADSDDDEDEEKKNSFNTTGDEDSRPTSASSSLNPWRPLIHKRFIQKTRKMILDSSNSKGKGTSVSSDSKIGGGTASSLLARSSSPRLKIFVCFAWVLGRSDLAKEHSELEQLRDLLREASKDPDEISFIFSDLYKSEAEESSSNSNSTPILDGIEINIGNLIFEVEQTINFVSRMYHE